MSTVFFIYFPAAGFDGFAAGLVDFSAGPGDLVPGCAGCGGAAIALYMSVISTSKISVAFGSTEPEPSSP